MVGGLAGEEWILVNGVRWTEAGGKPICYVQSYVPKRFEHVVEQFSGHQGPFFELLERHAEGSIQEVVQEIRALPMPPEFIRQGGVLIASVNWHPADQMTYVMRIHRAREQPAD